jgi:hypothetical protein
LFARRCSLAGGLFKGRSGSSPGRFSFFGDRAPPSRIRAADLVAFFAFFRDSFSTLKPVIFPAFLQSFGKIRGSWHTDRKPAAVKC